MSNFRSENAQLVIGKVDNGPYTYLINKITNSLLMLRMNEEDKSIAVNAQTNGAWGSEKLLATKDDLTPVNFEFTGGNGSTIVLNKSCRIGKLVVVSLKIKIDTVTKDVATYSGSAKNAGTSFAIGKGGEWSILSSTYAYIGNGVLTVRTEGLAVGDYLHIHGIIILD